MNPDPLWLVLHGATGELVAFSSLQRATEWALHQNRRNDHCNMFMWELAFGACRFKGQLFRDFGCDFDPINPWKDCGLRPGGELA